MLFQMTGNEGKFPSTHMYHLKHMMYGHLGTRYLQPVLLLQNGVLLEEHSDIQACNNNPQTIQEINKSRQQINFFSLTYLTSFGYVYCSSPLLNFRMRGIFKLFSYNRSCAPSTRTFLTATSSSLATPSTIP